MSTTSTTTSPLFYLPKEGWFGDVMPVYWDGVFHLFYTHLDFDDHGGPGRTKQLRWAHLSTRDFVSFDEHPTAIPAGQHGEQDVLAGAGSVVGPVDSMFHAYYVGIDPHVDPAGREQVVLHATSDDLDTWTKDPAFEFVADERWYDPNAWRDPFVVADGRGGWVMLLCAQGAVGPARRAGAVGRAVSQDLIHWEAVPPLFQPGTTLAPECPEVFELAGREYLLYSTYSDRFVVQYRIRQGDGWSRPTWDTLDSNDFYASTSVTDGEHRYLVGWLATRQRDQDAGLRQWGGELVVHELTAQDDGTLAVSPLPSRVDAFRQADLDLRPRSAGWTLGPDTARFDVAGADSAFGWVDVTDNCERASVSLTLDASLAGEEVGIALQCADDFSAAYLLRFEPARGRFVFDRRPHRIDVPFDHDVDRSYVTAPDFEIERPLTGDPSKIRVRIFVEGTIISIYVNDVALTTHGYDLQGGIALYAAGGSVLFSEIEFGRS